MARLAAAVWIILLAGTGQQAECFNLDQDNNVVRFFRGGNEQNSLFGFSLAPYSFSDNHTSILVGAPNEVGPNGTRRTGAVYRCQLDKSDNNCNRLVPFDSYTDQQVLDTVPAGLNPNNFEVAHSDSDIRVEGQMLGYSIDANNDFATACAPHYSQTIDPTGFNDDNDVVDVPQYDGRCVVLRQNENFSTPHAQFPQINILGQRETSLRSFGTSAKLASTVNGVELFTTSLLSGSIDHPFGRLYRVGIDPTSPFSDTENTLRTEQGVNGYLGFHIEVGYITSSDNLQVIASAPRDELHQGSVSVWNDVYRSPVLSLVGMETDGYFGYDFAVLSQAENDYDNLVVGCPLCSNERGMVYYYPNDNGMLDDTTRVMIPAPNQNQKGRFGISVESIGDMDRDGYYDVAVAAPLEVGQRDDGTEYTGVVYVFRGDSATTILTQYSQVVYGYSSVPMFGYSLSGGTDIDDNNYPDLIIGGVSTSVNSEITLLRSAPVVTVEAEIIVPDEPLVLNDLPDIYECTVEKETVVVCFNVSLCFNYSLLPEDSVDKFKIQYTLSSDSRVFTNRSDINSDSSITREFTIIGEDRTQCENHTVYLQPNIAELTDLMFELKISDSSDPVRQQDGLHPVLNIGRVTEWSEMVELNSTCEGVICRPELELLVDYTGSLPVYLNERFNISFNITVVNNGEEDGFAFTVKVMLPYQGITKLEEIPHQEGNLQSSCEPTSSLIIECPIKSPISFKETVSFDLVLVPTVDGIPLNTSEIKFDFELTDDQNADTNLTNNFKYNITKTVKSIARYGTSISAGGADPLIALQSNSRLNQFVMLKNIPTDPTELGPLSPVEIIIRNDDRSESRNTNSPIPFTEVLIFWPTEIMIQTSGSNTKFPFLVPIPRQLQVQPPENTLCKYHDLFPSSLSAEDVANASFPNATTAPSRELYPEHCNKSIKCGVIICEASNLASDRNVINIFINSVLYSPAVTGNQEVNISVLVRNKGAYPEVKQSMEHLTLRVQTAIPDIAEDCVNVWIPIVAAIGGFVILVLIATLLGCLGFFTRQNRFKRYLDERRGVHMFDDDESYAPRIVVPDYEYEASGEAQFVSFGRAASCEGSIKDESGILNGTVSPFANGYGTQEMMDMRTGGRLLSATTEQSNSPPPYAVMMEYTDSDIITTASSQRSLDKQPNNFTHPELSSSTASVKSKETEL